MAENIQHLNRVETLGSLRDMQWLGVVALPSAMEWRVCHSILASLGGSAAIA